MRKNILIRNARIFNAETGVFSPATDIRITDGIVAEIAENIPVLPGYEVIEKENLCASSGWTDCHTHVEAFDPASYLALGVTRVHDAGSNGAYDYEKFHGKNGPLQYPLTSYLYVGVHGAAGLELKSLDYLQEEPFLEMAAKYPDEILGAKIRIDPRVNCDTLKSMHMAKELAVKAGLPLVVHPSRCTDGVEEIMSILDKGDVYAHTYSPVSPGIFDEDGKIKQCLWDAMERGVLFDLSHGSNNFGYDMARQAISQGFIVHTISTDLHGANFGRPGMDLAGVMTKAIQAGIPLEEALKKVIIAPCQLLGVKPQNATIEVGQNADITVFTVSDEGIELPDSIKKVELCQIVVDDVATVLGGVVTRSIPNAIPGDYWKDGTEEVKDSV